MSICVRKNTEELRRVEEAMHNALLYGLDAARLSACVYVCVCVCVCMCACVYVMCVLGSLLCALLSAYVCVSTGVFGVRSVICF